ncbi:MAG: sugar phosphate isomerase/epimerase, partial [Planctomycetota bacterium]|nr:sugar phosphate isomerase/epimerase [Planctomycetota bacterium]
MKNILQINYWTIGGFEGKKPLDQAIRETKALGFDGLELAFGAGDFAPGISLEKCRELAAYAKAQGIALATTCTGVYWNQSLTSPRPEVRRQAVAFTKDYLRATAGVGAKVALVVPGAVAVPWDQSQPVVPYADAWKRAAAG